MILTFYKKKWELRSSSYQFLQSQVLHIECNWSLEYHADFRQLDGLKTSHLGACGDALIRQKWSTFNFHLEPFQNSFLEQSAFQNAQFCVLLHLGGILGNTLARLLFPHSLVWCAWLIS